MRHPKGLRTPPGHQLIRDVGCKCGAPLPPRANGPYRQNNWYANPLVDLRMAQLEQQEGQTS